MMYRTPWSTQSGDAGYSTGSKITLLAREEDMKDAEFTVRPALVAYSNFEGELGCKLPFSSLQLVSKIRLFHVMFSSSSASLQCAEDWGCICFV